jgi:flagellar protein FliL
MATEETQAEAAPEAAAKAGGGLVKAIGTTVGLFILMMIAQLAGPVVGCKFLHAAMPNCPAPEVKVGADGKPVEEKAPKAPPIYLAMDPPLVASFQEEGNIRFLQVTVEVMARDEKIIAEVKNHMPVIRNNLLMMMGGQSLQALTTRDQKEALRQTSLKEVQRILKENTGAPGVEDLYFTSFVVQ